MTANAQQQQVGINTAEPKATLHVEAGASENKGVIIPRITAAEMKTMTIGLGADHHSMMTYLKEQMPTADRTGKLVDVADPGYYYYDNTTGVQKWKTFGGAEQDFKVLPASVPGRYNYLTKGAGVGGNGTSVGTGFDNIAIGKEALYSNTTGESNIAQGQDALKFNTTGGSNIAQGSSALYSNTTGSNNIAQGRAALYFNTTGGGNIAQGYYALYNNTTGGFNIAQGSSALYFNTTGSNNIAQGRVALRTNTTGSNNIAQGWRALYFNTTGSDNIAQGQYTLTNSTTGESNIAIGQKALSSNISGSYNTTMGFLSGNWITGNGNIHIGMDITTIIPNASGKLNNVIAIGHFPSLGSHSLNTTTANDNVILLGSASSTAPKVGVGTYKPQAKLDVAGAVRVANDTSACTSANEGTIRYVSASKKFQGCDGTNWVNLN